MEIKITCDTKLSVALENLLPFQGELKTLSEVNYQKLKKQILEEGFCAPVFVWKNDGKYYLCDGHQRTITLNKMKDEGYKVPDVPAVEIQAKTKREAKKKLLSYVSQFGKVDPKGLYQYILDAELTIEDMDDFEIPEIDMDSFKEEFFPEDQPEGAGNEDNVPEVAQNELGVKLGDIYQLGEHRLMCGDSTDLATVEKLMNGEKADMVFTDPPYNMETTGRGSFAKAANALNKQLKGLVDFCPKEFLGVLPNVFQDRMSAFIFCNKDLIPDYLNWCLGNKYNFNVLTWHKKSHVPFTSGSHYPDTEYLLFINKKAIFNSGLSPEHYRKYWITEKTEKEFGHPTQKPIEIIQVSIETWSNKLGIVTDFFLGSGSTLIACEKTNRKCYGMELDPHYCSVIIKRFEEYTGKKHKKL